MSHVRHVCPALSAPMETGDGLLVRILPTGVVPLDALIALCEAARAHGNGVMEITARGSIQVRGLTPFSAPLFAAAVSRLDLAISDGVAVIADPLPDDSAALIDANSLADDLHRAIAANGLRLAPKLSVMVDGGGRFGLDALFADIRLDAVATPHGPKLQLALAGDAMSATPLGTIAQDEAVGAVLTLLTSIAALGPEARAADLLPAPSLVPEKPQRHHSEGIGYHPLKDGAFALGFGLAFGQAQADALAELARAAQANGAGWARPAPGRVLLLGPVSTTHARALTHAAQALDFVTETDDPRRRIAACPGTPACAHGLIAARALAAEIAGRVPLTGNGIVLHVSGCAKGCAHPKPAPLTVVGTEQGCGLVSDGAAQATPSAYCGSANLVAELGRRVATARETVDA